MPSGVDVTRFPVTDYEAAWRWQIEAATAVAEQRRPEVLALLQHEPVYTFGRRAHHEHLLEDHDALRRRGATLVESDRGGDITFHGPGQLVAYPILNLKARGLGPVDYVRLLEQVLIDSLAAFGLDGQRVPGRPGVWLSGGKVAAIGVRVQRGVSTHGFALNVNTDLSWFEAIVPCGISDAAVTSMARATGHDLDFEAVEQAVAEAFESAFDVNLTPVSERIETQDLVAHGN